ncbi:MAG: hypothetical protein Q4E53_06400 [Eubacteriales bacterium]|nr:hypothetical protein [Eubacteriales bacterium]
MMRKELFTRLTAVSMATIMAFSMIGCTGNNKKKIHEPTTATTVVNPINEMSEEKMVEQTGVDLPIPEEATDVSYSVIEAKDGNIAQVDFTLEGQKMYLRACITSLTNLADSDNEADLKEINTDNGDISGLFYNWNQAARVEVEGRDAMIHVTNKGVGYIAWLDVVPGILYNLCMEENANMENLQDFAEEVFVPMQGES